MASWTLENDCWRITVKAQGAELCELLDKRQQRQRLWTPDPAVWNNSATQLFPVVGRLIHNGLHHDGEFWPLPAHGFLRQQRFRLVKQRDDRLTLCCEESPETQAIWPFRWRVTTHWHLTATGLTVRWQVENRDSRAFPFALGWHPGFALPIATQPGWSVRFDRPASGPFFTDNRTLITPETPARTTGFALTADSFTNGAVYFGDMADCGVSVISPQGDCTLRLDSPQTPWLALWSVPGADLLCIEPLTGTTDDPQFDGDVCHKRGMQWLAAGDTYHQQLSVTLAQDGEE